MLKKTLGYSCIMLVLTVLTIISSGTCAENNDSRSGIVKYVIDGDTIILQDNRHVRYIGINAPEIEIKKKNKKGEPFGEESKIFNNKLVSNKKIRMEFDQTQKDQYGRTLAYIFLEDGTFVNGEMIKQGLAFCLYDKQNNQYADKLLKLQQKAMSQENGIWSRIKKINGNIVGNSNSRRFHKPECELGRKTSKRNKVRFNLQWEAFEKGYSPGKKCFGIR